MIASGLFWLCFSLPGQGQTSCTSVDQTTLCSGETLPAAATTELGDDETAAVNVSGSSRSSLNRAGENLIENSSTGEQSIASQAGTTTIVNDSEGQVTTINRADDTTFVNQAEGNVVVCQEFGSVTLCN